MPIDVDSNMQCTLGLLAMKAIKKSGGQFFKTVQKRIVDHMDDVTDVLFTEEDIVASERHLTSENLLLLARFYAGEITKTKRKRHGTATLHDRAIDLLKNAVFRAVCNTILLKYLLTFARLECEERAQATQEDFWANQYYETIDWDERATAIDESQTVWNDVADLAEEGEWEQLFASFGDLVEVDAY